MIRLNETATRNLRNSWNAVHQSAGNGNNIAILEEGITFKGTQIDPEKGQLLPVRTFQNLDIARLASVPPHKIGDYSQSHLANVEESNLDYLNTTLLGWIEAFEAEGDLKLLTDAELDAGLYIGHDMSRLVRGNMTARIAYYRGMRELGAINSDEIRARETMNPIGKKAGGKKYLVQGQLAELADAGSAYKQPPAPPAKATTDAEADDQGDTDAEAEGLDEPSKPATDTPNADTSSDTDSNTDA